MWEIIDQRYKVTITIVAAVIIYLCYYTYVEQSIFRAISYTISTITFLAWIVGKYLWKLVYCDLFKRHLCPNFNGKWLGTVSSNYEGSTQIIIPIEIEADFFSIKIKAKTTIGRTYTTHCKVLRTEDNCYELEYMFKGFNDTPSNTDTTYYEGAARVRVGDPISMDMKGLFWTNRCWQQGKNTAGTIEFVKTAE